MNAYAPPPKAIPLDKDHPLVLFLTHRKQDWYVWVFDKKVRIQRTIKKSEEGGEVVWEGSTGQFLEKFQS